MNEVRYIMDANILSSKMVSSIIMSSFFQKKCIILDEIAYELRNTSIGSDLEQIKVSIPSEVLNLLPSFIDELITEKILELDKGNGDVLLIAYAMYIASNRNNAQSQFQFITEMPIIVTEERAIQNYCTDNSIEWLNLRDFIKVYHAAEQSTLF